MPSSLSRSTRWPTSHQKKRPVRSMHPRACLQCVTELLSKLGGSFEAGLGAEHRAQRERRIDLDVRVGELLLGALESRFGALDVDLFGLLHGFGQHADFVRQDLHKSAVHREEKLVAVGGVAGVTGPELRQQWRV